MRNTNKKPPPSSKFKEIPPACENKLQTESDSFTSSSINKEKDQLVVVGIGASAGGLEALQQLIPDLPVKANVTYVIAQHLDPKHRSMLVSLLDRKTAMEVLEVKNGQKAQSNTIYITPPDRDVTISNGVLRLSKPSTEIGPKPSVDYFFTSLAEDKGENAVGIILSGTGSDGAHGIRAIKAGGGITIVQDESTAKYNGMPRAAIEMGHVDIILPPKRIGSEILEIIKHPHVAPIVPIDEKVPDNFERILQMLFERTGCNFSEYKPNTIRRRIERRMAVQKLEELKDYITYLKNSSNELNLLYKDILISVTAFFRDVEAFKALEAIIPRIIENKKSDKNIRIWVPGCANGEEAYSIAIVLSKFLGDRINRFNIQIFGTDIDEDAILRARKGVYSEATVVDVDKQIRDRYFMREDNVFQVIKPIREMVVFARQNMAKDPPFSRLDLISCRNVLIYFKIRLQKRMLSIFHYVLNTNGFLFLGKSESIGQFDDLFVAINKRWKIFQCREILGNPPPIDLGEHNVPKYQSNYRKQEYVEKEPSIKDAVNLTIAEAYGHNSVAIDEKMDIMYVRGDVSPYLKLGSGEAVLNILNMARDGLRLDLRSLIHKSVRENIPVRSKKIKLKFNNENRVVTIDVRPIPVRVGIKGLSLISFEEEISVKKDIQHLDVGESGLDPRITEMEHELTAMRERLQTTVEELETANEELQSMNEELQSTNEELQSSNEELETSNEELQSTNEELTTVNEEIQVKSTELAYANADLENILKRLGFAMVIVDKGLKVTRFTPLAAKIFTLKNGDIGQVITTIPCEVSLPNLRDNMLHVIRDEKPVEQEVNVDDRFYWMRILPYYSEHNKVTGAILTFLDRTEIKCAEEKILYEKNLLDTIEGEVCIIDNGYHIINANKTFLDAYGLETEVFGKNCHEVIYNTKVPCVAPDYPCPFNDVIKTGKPISIVHTKILPGGSKKQLDVSISPIINIKGNIDRFLHITKDASCNDNKKNE